MSGLDYEALAAWADAAAGRVADPRAKAMLSQQAEAIREVVALRAENARLREALDRIARKPWVPTDPRMTTAEMVADMVRQIVQFAHDAVMHDARTTLEPNHAG